MKSVSEIRNLIRDQRRSISQQYRAAASARICESFCRLESFGAATKIAGFLAFDGEADPLGLMMEAHQRRKQVFVPIIVGKHRPMMFAPWSPITPIKTNNYGIAEPEVDEASWVPPQQLDFVITPLVAFDRQCNRIGVGGGYYDRSFAFLNSQEVGDLRTTPLYGFAFEMQKVPRIDCQEWDIRLTGVVTESSVYVAGDD